MLDKLYRKQTISNFYGKIDMLQLYKDTNIYIRVEVVQCIFYVSKYIF